MSIKTLKQNYTKACVALHVAVQPLRERLREVGFIISWRDGEYHITDCFSRFMGFPISLDDDKYDVLISMSDKELRRYCSEKMHQH